MNALPPVREDLRGFTGYASARRDVLRGDVWLNANEAATANAADAGGACRRYPDPRPPALLAALAALYGCDEDALLVGRGSDEAIDLLVRALCRPAEDPVVVTPPVFGMYAVSARLQGAPLVEVRMREDDGDFAVDLEAVASAALDRSARLVFLCSPSNPTGGAIGLEAIAALALRLAGRALVVVDEAYGEYSATPSATGLVGRHPNVAVLRTLSKAHGLAGARIGCLVADPALVAVLRACQAPYPIPAPCTTLALAALSPPALAATRVRVAETVAERERMRSSLSALPGVRRVLASAANFLLVRFDDAGAAFDALLEAGVVVRDQRSLPGLPDALRITVGTPEENARVLVALRARREVAA